MSGDRGRTGEGAQGDEAGDLGVYVHVPFCTRRCDYCAFATWTDRFHLVEEYLGACRDEISRALEAGGGIPAVTSMFFGGGTPSLLEPEQIARLIGLLPLAVGAEVTVECNPDSVDEERLAGYRVAGVNRLSFGVQSMVPHVLQSLGRSHDPASVRRALDAAAQAGYAGCCSVDLIYGAVGESMADWESTLTEVLSLDPPPAHVSAYALTVEPGTPLSRDPARSPDPDDQADKYMLADAMLSLAGLGWYEISNWAAPGARCLHNSLYWAQGEYIGIGCAAHSHRIDPVSGAARRWWNLRTPQRYIDAVSSGRSPVGGEEVIDARSRRLERLELRLRTREGVPADSLPGWDCDPDLAGLLEEVGGGRVGLTLRGRLLANEVAVRLSA